MTNEHKEIEQKTVWFTPIEAADYTRHAVQTLAKRRLYGKEPVFHKIGRKILYKRDDLDAWLNAHQHSSTSEY